ncbi:hypothetical protein HispidOSU_005497, partial [Sigmodon hispidus]
RSTSGVSGLLLPISKEAVLGLVQLQEEKPVCPIDLPLSLLTLTVEGWGPKKMRKE